MTVAGANTLVKLTWHSDAVEAFSFFSQAARLAGHPSAGVFNPFKSASIQLNAMRTFDLSQFDYIAV